MTPKRPRELKFTGDRYEDGRPVYFLDFVPDRDLTEEETDALSQEQLADIRASGLYREVMPPEPKKSKKAATKKAAPKKAATLQPKAPQATEESDAGNQQDTAAEPATEGEGEA